MGIQNNFNDGLFQIATIASLQQINNSIKELGFNSYHELCNAINQLKIEIAKNKDKGETTTELEILLDEYISIKEQYDEQRTKENDEKIKNRKINIAIICLLVAFGLVGLICYCTWIFAYV